MSTPTQEEFDTCQKVLKYLSKNPKELFTTHVDLLQTGKETFQKPLYSDFKKREYSEIHKDTQESNKKKKIEPIIEEVLQDDYKWKPIGYFSSCFKVKNATPRQGNLCPLGKGKFTFTFGHNPAHALEDLKDFSHVWLLFLFHENREKPLNIDTMKMKIRPPRLMGDRVSIFATRTPHRPNKIGLSRAKIDKIDGPTIYFSGIDLIEGTPIIDIKPYIPEYDSIPEKECRVAKWITSPNTITKVTFTEDAIKELKEFLPKCEYYHTMEETMDAITQILQLDPRSVSRKKSNIEKYAFYVDNLNVIVVIKEGECTVTKVEYISDFTSILARQHDKVVEQRSSSKHQDNKDDCEIDE
jgi:tRNA-Thr(GGU) m(6)t(6)A37 methyltransferase TsaA